MASFEFKLPDIGEGVTEGEIVKWLVAPGDIVKEDQPMVEVMTDKATVTITAPKAGKILETRAKEGQVVAVHSVLVVFDLDGDKPAAAPAVALAPAVAAEPTAASTPKAVKNDGPAATAVGDIKEDLPGMNLMPLGSSHTTNGITAAPVAAYYNEKPLATPATRKLARDLGVDLRRVSPTGPSGRVTKDDVRGASTATTPVPLAMHTAVTAHVPESLPTAPAPLPKPIAAGEPHPAAAPAPVTAKAPAPMRVPPPPAGEESLEERIPLRGMRRRIFDQMSRSKHTAAHFTFVEECDVTALKELRARLKPAADKANVKLTFLPFFVKAVVAALKKHPSLNSAFDETTQEIVQRRYFDIGIASATDAGLIVPVVRRADRKSILDIARDIQRLGDDTKAGKVRSEDLGGSTFTITSLGAQGGLFATPILNFPEVAILGIHQMKQKPVVRDGQIVIGDVMLLSLSFDHRIIDGHVGAAFAYEIIGYLENPDRLFLEMA
ncbi:dihydrolipoamide acetyltransferase family protein [Polyangium jinanense]|uniref:Dihydrolipoamide acetyltransferase component of pyruvate dehydrogenase complex n=1 Tax=Polyangium jinanense TaxID=2829994 RepID=A0A9X3XCX3_9BACT|nr:dihydrolipoamide acetyltransferase family protein [Polyangium jinanense]MDC3959327.1 2-oxo acid dehydrogenase subunit E2 [Polyangium jinanense]MDC3985736.1 2-oxo acid dehydrogenase subunit E2 [Polyangium jinanense]